MHKFCNKSCFFFGKYNISWFSFIPVGTDTSWYRYHLVQIPSWYRYHFVQIPFGTGTSGYRYQSVQIPVGTDTSWYRYHLVQIPFGTDTSGYRYQLGGYVVDG